MVYEESLMNEFLKMRLRVLLYIKDRKLTTIEDLLEKFGRTRSSFTKITKYLIKQGFIIEQQISKSQVNTARKQFIIYKKGLEFISDIKKLCE